MCIWKNGKAKVSNTMETIILGTGGNQPFEIKQAGVSREHASITIGDDGTWTLADLGSTNGTFVRTEDGELRRVSKMTITPMTFICLGPDNSNGCSFYALHVKTPNNYYREFEYLNNLEDKFDEKATKAERKNRAVKVTIALTSLVAFVGSFLTEGHHILQLMLLRVGSVVSGVSTMFFDPRGSEKKLKAEKERFHRCPNPACSHVLRSDEIRDMQCGKCKCK